MPRIRAGSIPEHKEKTRREVLDAAAALFKAQGYEATGLGDISALVGIGRTTLYEYFTDKEDILVQLVEQSMPDVIDRILDGLPQGESRRDRLAELLVRLLGFISDDNEVGSLVMREIPKLSAETQVRVRHTHKRLEDAIYAVCVEGIESGEFNSYDALDAARLVSSVMMTASQSLIRSGEAKQRVHEVADLLVRFVFDGLAR